MPMVEGFFELQTAKDLLRKLQHDSDRLKKSPVDSHAAFDFFVTAYHMLEWKYPNGDGRTQTYLENWFQVCRHLANGAKHFQAVRGNSVKNTLVHKGAFDQNAFSHAFDVSELRVELDGEAAREFGPSIGVLELADKVLHFWQERVK
jgi:hypothetical protein